MDNKKTDIGEKVMVFIDGSNVYHIIKNLFPDRKPNNLNFKKFVSYLVGNRRLVRAYYYNAPLDRKKDEDSYIKQQKFFEKIRRIPNFNFVLCRMQKRKVDGKVMK